jgi:hypothetical protein
MTKIWNWLYSKNISTIEQNSPYVSIIENNEENEIFNLIFHFHCVRHEKVCYSIAKLEEHLSIFNGHKIFTISSPDDKFDNNPIFKLLIQKFAKKNVHFIPVTNNKISRETLHFFDKACPLLTNLLEANKQEKSYTFYGHSKGCTHPEKDYVITSWVNTLFKYNLDLFYNKIKPELLTNKYKFVSCLKTENSSSLGVDFHYAGTFFWFDTSILFNNTFLRGYDHKLGLEMWPGHVASDSECLSVFNIDNLSPYRYDCWYNLVYNRTIDVPKTFPCSSIGA